MTGTDREAFQRLAGPYRAELQLHCYRMLGSVADADDLVQETLLRAWRGFDRFEARSSLRTWLYRIATNACLNALATRSRRVLPESQGPPAASMPQGDPAAEVAWLEPFPDSALEGIADAAPGPEARYEEREAVRLAFVAAIQHLPPRQRAALLLHDVLRFTAAETADLLDTSTAAVNSALQRARATLGERYPAGPPSAAPAPDDLQRALLDRYVRAWEEADLDGFVALLREDAVLSMPPWRQWYAGREAIGRFFAWAWDRHGCGDGTFTFVPVGANRQPAFGVYIRDPGGPERRGHTIHVLDVREGAIAGLVYFRDARLFAAFGLPATLPGASAQLGDRSAGSTRSITADSSHR
jgi:RNA polymerase sigma-70 factor, ECF subfamily